MSREEQLAELLLRWEESLEGGSDLVPEALCRDCPELAPELSRRIHALKVLGWVKEPVGEADRPDDPAADANGSEDPRVLAGRYRLDRRIGAGGFGEVWRGFDLELQRTVAVKLSGPGRPPSAARAAAVPDEARKLARLKHPGIVPVHDAGRDGGRYFFVTDLVEGQNLADRLRRGRPSPEQAARLVAAVAVALAHAHRQGFIHRDIKPANILLDAEDRPFLTDFGIAVEQHEQPRDRCGTLAYMAPEQLGGAPPDPRTDVYSLGVVLHEVLTGRLPSAAADPVARRAPARAGRPRGPRRLDRRVPRELAHICLKCLAADPAGRYAGAGQLAADLEAYLRRRRAARRTRFRWLLGAGAVLLLAGLVIPLLLFSLPRRKPPEEPPAALVRCFRVQTGQVLAVAFAPDGRRLLAGGMDCTLHLWDVDGGAEVRRFEGHTNWVRCVAFSPDGRWALSGSGGTQTGNTMSMGDDHAVRLWDVATGQEVRRFVGHREPVLGVAFSPDGRRFLSASDDGTVRLWATDRPGELRCFTGHAGQVHAVAFSSNGREAYSAGEDGTVRRWDVDSGAEVRRFEGSAGQVRGVAVSPNTHLVLSGGEDAAVRLWHAQSGREWRRLAGHGDQVMAVAFAPDGRRVLSGSLDGSVRLWDVTGGGQIQCYRGHLGGVTAVGFAGDGGWAASAGEDGTARVWALPP